MINFKNFYKRVNFDIDYYAEERFMVKQNDTKSRGFYVKIIQDGRVVKPSASEKLTFYGKKPDGTDIFQDGVLDGGEFRIDLPNQAFTAPGEMRSEFSLRGPNGELISTKDFTITVIESFPMDPIESTDDFSALQSALAQVTGFAGELQDAQLFAESIKANLGELEDLDTDVKENVVAAINELNGKIDNVLGSGDLETLLNTKVDKDTLGDMSQLETEEKEVLVLAINELFNSIEEVKDVSDVSSLIQLLNAKADKSTVGDIANLVDFNDETVEVGNLVEAINYTYQLLIDSLEGLGEVNFEGLALSEDLGDKEELTTADKTNLVSAINEINAALKTVESVTDVEQLSILLSGKADKSSLGNLSELTTVQKNNLVAAINEINAIIDGLGDVDFTEIYTLLEAKVSQEDFDTALNAIELTPGPQGEPGQPGKDGLSAYQIWLNEGNEGTEQDFLEALEGPQGPQGPPGPPGDGGSGGGYDGSVYNLGSYSSDEPIEDRTNIFMAQVNVSENSSATAVVPLINVSESEVERWEPIDIERLRGDFETYYLVDGAFVYAEVYDYGEFVDILLEDKGYGADVGLELYPVKFTSFPSQVNASSGSEASGHRSQVNASEGSKAEAPNSQVNASKGSQVNADETREDGGGLSQINASQDSTASGYMSQVNASVESEASGEMSQVNASERSYASGYMSQVNASDESTASGVRSQTNASEKSEASGRHSQVNVSSGSEASGYISQVSASSNSTAEGMMSQVSASEYSSILEPVRNSQINASDNSSIEEGEFSQINASQGSAVYMNNSQINASQDSAVYMNNSQVNASSGVGNDTPYSSAWGYGPLHPSYGEPLTENIKIHLLSQSGDINHSGVLNSGHNSTDYAELFPNLVGEEQGYGLIQTVEGHGVRPANSGDQVVGVTSATAGVILGETSFSWAERWLKDEWGAFIMEDVIDEDWEPEEGQTEEDRPVHRLPKENPDYDPEREYAKRQDRPDEWTVVGLVGQVYVRLDENVEPMDYVKPLKDGVGQTSSEPTNIRVMKITQEFDEDKGYKIGFCLLK